MVTSRNRRILGPAYFAAIAALTLPAAPATADEKGAAAVPADHARKMEQGLALFKQSVREVLIKHCLDCHGGKSTKGDFNLSDRQALIDSGAIEGPAKETTFYAVISHAEEPFMPSKAPKLPDETIELIARWIDLGAPYDKPLVDRSGPKPKALAVNEEDRSFWSFRPLTVSAPPAVRRDGWARTPIDRFILAKQEEKGLSPNSPADRRTLIRRASFDLIGLPPSPEEVEAFVADPAPDAYDRLVDRLLDSPHFGERWARHWMDVARFAESEGYEQDDDRKSAYPYRDFLIKAFNEDMPYDQFVRWQVAGDELAPDDPTAMAATQFLGAGAFPTQITEAEFESARYNELDDMTSAAGSAFLGLTIGCARCHDHKFDPIPSEDYYRVLATFTTTIRSEVELPLQPGSKPTKVLVTAEGFPHVKNRSDERGYPHFYPKTYVLSRGDVNQKKGEATPGFLRVLMRDGKDESYWRVDPPSGWARSSFRRASLSRWLTDPEHGAGHLSARVIVNRLWQHHFGQGIVSTPNDFGTQGETPTHPELLDWLAVDLIHHGWTLKRLHKMMATSAVYMQDGRVDEARMAVDRENALLWRREPRRLEAEPIRDAMLAVSRLLDPTMFGPGSLDPEMRRRSVYFFIKRSKLVPEMMLFDWPEHLVSIGRRSETTTAPQALLFMNSPLGRRCAEGFAARLDPASPAEAVRRAYRIAFGRDPRGDEARLSCEFLARQAEGYEHDGKSDPGRLALVDLCQALMSMSEFIYIN
jgi:mono/diheme cytochrome c family protein